MSNPPVVHPSWCDPAECEATSERPGGSHASRRYTVSDHVQTFDVLLLQGDWPADTPVHVMVEQRFTAEEAAILEIAEEDNNPHDLLIMQLGTARQLRWALARLLNAAGAR